MQLLFRPEAETELLQAQQWYELQSPGLGYEFARAVEVAVEAIIAMPQGHPIIHDQLRHALLRRFPYSLIYQLSATEIVVLSCFHHKRKPDSWRNTQTE